VTAMRNISGAAAWEMFSKLPPGTADRDDLTAIADEALCKAVEAWPGYCERNGHDQAHGEREGYLVAYVNRRVRGAILDWARSSDWLTRVERKLVKSVQAAEAVLGGCSTEQAAAKAGVNPGKARQAVEAATGRRQVALDEHLNADGTTARDTVHDPAPGTESQVVTTAILAAVTEVIAGLDETGRAILTALYYEGWRLPRVAEALGLELAVARKAWEAAVTAVHDGMLLAAGDGCACSGGGRCSCTA